MADKSYTPEMFAADMRLTFDNATTFNQPGSYVYNAAKKLKALFEKMFSKHVPSAQSTAEKLKEIEALKEKLKQVHEQIAASKLNVPKYFFLVERCIGNFLQSKYVVFQGSSAWSS